MKDQKTGGRKKGTPNKATELKRQGLEEIAAKTGYDPLLALITLANDKDTPPPVKREIALDLMPYFYARKASESTGPDGAKGLRIIWDD